MKIKGRAPSTLLVAFTVQVALVLVTLFVVVLDPVEEEAPHFLAPTGTGEAKQAAVPQEAMSRFMRRMSNPKMLNRIQSTSASSYELPPMPELPKDAFTLDQADMFLAENAQTMLESSGLLADAAAMGSSGSGASFFGIEDSGQRIVIVVNTSASVVRKAGRKGVSISEIQDEVVALVDGLNGRVSFGVVQFSQGTESFAPHLAPAISKNKEAVRNWVYRSLKGSPPVVDEALAGHEGALWQALDLQPDVVFLVTDGVLNKRVRVDGGYRYPEISYDVLLSGLRRQLRERSLKTRINVIGFELSSSGQAGLKRLVREFGGSLREF